MNGKKQISYIQWLRMLAALAVVVIHADSAVWAGVPMGSREYVVLTVWESLVRWPVPVFVMITGALFLDRKTELKQVLTRYIPHLAAAFFFWSGVHALRGGTEGMLLRFVAGHYHLWYVPFACGVYLTIPFLQAIAGDRRLTRQLLWVSLVIGALVPWLADLAALCFPEWSGVMASVKNSLHFTFFFDLLGVVLLGHVLNTGSLTGKQRHLLYALGILGAAVTVPLTLWAGARTGSGNALFGQLTAPTTLCTAAAVFVFAKYNLTRLPKMVDWAASHSFGVYLSHVLILELLQERGIHVLLADPIWTVPALSAAVFVIALGLTTILRRVPVVGKYLT